MAKRKERRIGREAEIAALTGRWADKSNRVRAIAARYYLGAETIESLNLLTIGRPCHAHANTAPQIMR